MLFVGDDWAEGHHDIEIMDARGRALVKARLPEGVQGIGQLHGLIGERIGSDTDPEQVLIGIETDRGLWVAALVAAGYRVFVVNPRQTFRFRERFSPSVRRAMPATRMRWRTWSVLIHTSFVQLLATATWPKPSSSWRALIRA